MKKKTLIIGGIAAGGVFALGIAAVAVAVYSWEGQHSAWACTADWARLAPLPATARDIHIEVKGSSFTREFILTFEAPNADVDSWLRASPGPAVAMSAGKNIISPGGGAAWAEFSTTCVGATTRVKVRTYWS